MLLAALVALSACAADVGGFAEPSVPVAASRADPLAECCRAVEPAPHWLVAAADPAAPVLGRAIGAVVWRPGRLARHPAAREATLSRLEPLDIVLVSHKGRLSNHALPGLFAHTTVYLGTEAQLRRAGAWDDARVRRHHGAIRAGEWFVEADRHGVHLSDAHSVLDVDRLAVLRPCLPRPSRRRQALAAYFAAVGTAFDFHFDAGTEDAVFCAELVHRVLPEAGITERRAYGRPVVVPDEFVREAVRPASGLEFVLYLRARRNGWEEVPVEGLIADLAAAWQERTFR